ncbi:MAG: hypothetical protein ACRDOE_00970 [Streptosporangiaceae bacterium]
MAKPVLQIIIGSTRPGRLKPNEIMEQAAAAMLDELARWAGALRPLRSS